jgi:hypothetical protein
MLSEVKPSMTRLALKGAGESSATARQGNGAASRTRAAGRGNRSMSATPATFVFVTCAFSLVLRYNTIQPLCK